jgi:hypothetical protein
MPLFDVLGEKALINFMPEYLLLGNEFSANSSQKRKI